MSEKEVSYLHIIPFDLGYAFLDILNVDNGKNLQMTDDFIDKISLFCEQNNYHAERTFSLKKDKKKIYGYKCNDDIVDKSICRIRLREKLYVFILLSGIGAFVILDDDTACLEDINAKWESEIFRINYIKRKSQKAILSGKINDKEAKAFSDERRLMKLFMSKCWEILKLVSKKYNIKCIREYSSNVDYKYNGLSYVLTVYLLRKGVFKDKELEYLLYASFIDEIGISSEKANELIEKFQKENVYSCVSNQSRYMFSWAAVLAELENVPNSFDDIFSHTGLCRVVKQEIYVQSRWFLADNSLDNALKSFNNKLIGLQRLDGVLEHYEAELNNEISANMTTEEKEMLRHIIYTSDINSLYLSVKRQIKIQLRLKEEYEEKVKKRNVFVLSIFMAVFTACSLYSEVNDIITGEQQNIGLLVTMLVIAIGAVVIDYFNK